MKEKALCVSIRILVCVIFLLVQQSARSQVPDPPAWESFVRGVDNPLITDTFRMQTFAKLPTDNWVYTSQGKISIVETSQMQIEGKCGKYALKIPMNTEVVFEHYPLDVYKDISINVHVGGKDRKKGDNLVVKTYRPGYPEQITMIECKAENEKCSFSKSVTISKNPPGIDLITPNPVTDSPDSRYCLDSIYAYGTIPTHTLFTGNGGWNDTARWSHLPAARHRGALLKGDASIHSNISCDQLHIGKGNLRILPTGYLTVNNLTLYPDDSAQSSSADGSFLSSGTVAIQGSVTVEKTFSRKGEWFFFSLPFDVYPEGLDPTFQLGDGLSDTNGNYFYLKTYNGAQRATQESASGNWDTVLRTSLNPSTPLLQKGKGYLIALDAGADRMTLRFRSEPRAIPSDFGKNGVSPIPVTINTLSENQDHNGWYLCGNPLPSALPLREIEPNEALDGYVYLYDGLTYQAYPMDSDYALSPYSAFFVKATESTELSIRDITLSPKQQVLPSGNPLSAKLSEPGSTTVSNVSPASSAFSIRLIGKNLYLGNLKSPGNIHIFNINGKVVHEASVCPGESEIQLPLPRGFYILEAQMGENQEKHKFILP